MGRRVLDGVGQNGNSNVFNQPKSWIWMAWVKGSNPRHPGLILVGVGLDGVGVAWVIRCGDRGGVKA